MGVKGLLAHIQHHAAFETEPISEGTSILIDFHAWIFWLTEHFSPGSERTAEQAVALDSIKMARCALFFLELLMVNGLHPEFIVDGCAGTGTQDDFEKKLPAWQKRRQGAQSGFRHLIYALDSPSPIRQTLQNIPFGHFLMEFTVMVRKVLHSKGFCAFSCEGEGDRVLDWVCEAFSGDTSEGLPRVRYLLTNDTDLVLMPHTKVIFFQNLDQCGDFWAVFSRAVDDFMHSAEKVPEYIRESRETHFYSALGIARNLSISVLDFPALAALCGGDYFAGIRCPNFGRVKDGARTLRDEVHPSPFEYSPCDLQCSHQPACPQKSVSLKFPDRFVGTQRNKNEVESSFRYTCLFYRVFETSCIANERIATCRDYEAHRRALYGLRTKLYPQWCSPSWDIAWATAFGYDSLLRKRDALGPNPDALQWYYIVAAHGGSSTLASVRGDNHSNFQRVAAELQFSNQRNRQHPLFKELSAAASLLLRKRLYQLVLAGSPAAERHEEAAVCELWDADPHLKKIRVLPYEKRLFDPTSLIYLDDSQRVQLCVRAIRGLELGPGPLPSVTVMGPAEIVVSHYLAFAGKNDEIAKSILVSAILLATFDGTLATKASPIYDCIDWHLPSGQNERFSLSGGLEFVRADINRFRLPDQVQQNAAWWSSLARLFQSERFVTRMQELLTSEFRRPMNSRQHSLSSMLLISCQRLHLTFSPLTAFYSLFLLTLNASVLVETLVDFHLIWWVHNSLFDDPDAYPTEESKAIRNVRKHLPNTAWFQSLASDLEAQGMELLESNKVDRPHKKRCVSPYASSSELG